MKKLTLIILSTISWFQILATEKNIQTIKSELQSATVYYGYGAELNHLAKANLIIGIQQIILNNIALQPDMNTIQIGCPENVVLMSYRFAAHTETKTVQQNPLIKKVTDSLNDFQKQQAAITNNQATTEEILNRTSKLIEANLANNPKKEISSEELIKLTEYYAAKYQMLKDKAYTFQIKKQELDVKINELNRRIAELNNLAIDNAKTITTGQIILDVMTQSATNAEFNVSYFTTNAGWIPTYDLRVKSIDNSMKLSYKAAVSQTTGIDWKNVKLSLSTSNPNQVNKIPILNPWFLNLYVPVLYNKMIETTTDFKKIPLAKQAIVSNGASYEIKNDEDVSVAANVAAYTTLNESKLFINFDIDLPYDIPSDGKAYSVGIKDEQVREDCKHYAIPKLDSDAFLVAEISDWEKLNLLPGEANIILDNVYIGKSFIDPNSTVDTLTMSLGRDKRIAVKRTLVKELTKSKIKGDNKSETFTYEISIRNNKKQPVEIILKDQYPLSNVKEVEITLDEKSNAEVNAETGILTYKLKLDAGENKKYRFSYTVKYPRDKVIQNLR